MLQKNSKDQKRDTSSNLVAAVYGVHTGSANALQHEGVAGDDGEEGEEVDGQEVVNDEGSLDKSRGEDLAAVNLGAKPVSCL